MAASVSGKERDRKFLDTNTEFVRFLPNVSPYIRPDGMSMDDWRDNKLADLENMILEVGADKVAAFIAEPILASGGVIIPPLAITKAVWIFAENMTSFIFRMKW